MARKKNEEIRNAKTSKEIVETKENLPAEVIEQMNTAYGLEEVQREDLIIPRIKMSHPNTKSCLVKKIPAGTFYNNLTEEQCGETFMFQPIKFTKAYCKFDKKTNDLIWRTTKPTPEQRAECEFPVDEEGRALLDNEGNKVKPSAQECLEFLGLINGEPMPVVLSFAKTSYKEGKKLLSIATLLGGALFSRHYTIASKLVEGDNTYYTYEIKSNAKVSVEEFQLAKMMYDRFCKVDLDKVVHEDEVQGEIIEEATAESVGVDL